MKKLIIALIALHSILPLVAMQEQNAIIITEEENKRFVQHTQMAVNYSAKSVAEQKISENNSLHIITSKWIPEYLAQSNNNLSEMIKQQELQNRLEEYKNFENDVEVKDAKEKLQIDANNLAMRSFLVKRRELLVNNHLESKQPTYSRPMPGEVQTDARLLFINRNEQYPLDEESVKDYIAALIYQYIIARRV
jgi:hypothetical protein